MKDVLITSSVLILVLLALRQVFRKTISRRLPHIYNIARRLAGKTDKEKAP